MTKSPFSEQGRVTFLTDMRECRSLLPSPTEGGLLDRSEGTEAIGGACLTAPAAPGRSDGGCGCRELPENSPAGGRI